MGLRLHKVDMFDCMMPTRNGRNGMLFTRHGTINIKNAKWRSCFEPIDHGGAHPMDERYTLAYLHHLFKAEELTGLTLASLHNVAFYLWLVGEARKALEEDRFTEWKAGILPELTRRL